MREDLFKAAARQAVRATRPEVSCGSLALKLEQVLSLPVRAEPCAALRSAVGRSRFPRQTRPGDGDGHPRRLRPDSFQGVAQVAC
jgi:hypothetical protein